MNHPNRSRSQRSALRRRLGAFSWLVLGGYALAATAGDDQLAVDIRGASIEELLNVNVTAVSKRPEQLTAAAAAVFVLTGEDIRRAGVTSIPEALRLVPGVQVARVDANKWAVSIRGFNARANAKLLVLIDGRAVYDQLFSGTFWEAQDVMLEDVERIEVVRGPGGAVWGANAVNGVIDIITKSARDTQGLLMAAGAGSEERAFAGVRYGTTLGNGVALRGYARYFDRAAGHLDDAPTYDDWRMARAGFRADFEAGTGDDWTVQGDVYDGEAGDPLGPPLGGPAMPSQDIGHNGANLLARWERKLENSESMQLQAYLDYTDYDNLTLSQERLSADVEFRHQLTPGHHDLVWGLRLRNTSDDIVNGPTIGVNPTSRSDTLASAFVQDRIWLRPDRLRLNLGTKVEHNDYTGFEVQPSLRLAWLPQPDRTVWAAVSRAVRTPSRIEDDLEILPILPRSGEVQAETLFAYEAGFRLRPAPELSLDVAAFFNDYDRLVTVEGTTTGGPYRVENRARADTYGLEIAARWHVKERWHLTGAYTYVNVDTRLRADSTASAASTANLEGMDPEHELVITSGVQLADNLQLDTIVRYADRLPTLATPGYVTADVRFGWQVNPRLDVSIVGRNLLDEYHFEHHTAQATEVARSVYAKMTLQFAAD